MNEAVFVYENIEKQERKPAEKRRKKQNAIFFIKWFTVGILINFLGGCGAPGMQETARRPASIQEAQNEQADSVTKPEPETGIRREEPEATWHASTKEHDIGINSSIAFGNNRIIWNFSNCTAVGASLESDVVTETEADYGFILTVIDEDSVLVEPYSNTEPYVSAVSLYAEKQIGDGILNKTFPYCKVVGYSGCGDGLGLITVTFSNGDELTAGVFKENGRLYAVNVAEENDAKRCIRQRENLESLIGQYDLTMEDALFTDPIYYPIVPGNENEHTDTQYWIDFSDQITEPEWTDAHKVMSIYNYIIENFAYDEWVVMEGANNSRTFYHKDYTGTYFISRTHVGVCEDFSEVFAIMCRAQGIPAFVIGTDTHAMSACYIEDYGRWLVVDTTSDIMQALYEKDLQAERTPYRHAVRYSHLNRLSTGDLPKNIYIGNPKDMVLHNIPTLMD